MTSDTLTRSGANELARYLRERYKAFPHFKAAVFMFPNGKSGSFDYVVRTNMVNGSPPTKPSPINPPDAAHLRKPIPDREQFAA